MNTCPVRGAHQREYDYSCTVGLSEATAAKIPGVRFQAMQGIGHFPFAENPKRFAEYLLPEGDRATHDHSMRMLRVMTPHTSKACPSAIAMSGKAGFSACSHTAPSFVR